MTHRVAGAPLDFADIRRDLEVPGDFSADVLEDARRSAADPARPAEDRTDIPLVTIDPPGSRDLDQAVHIARVGRGSGFLVSYAIADVAAFVRPGSAVDTEAHRRGETLYFPDARVPLHPPVLSEGAASLLPGETRPAVLWRVRVDAGGAVLDVDVRRALVRSTSQLDYPGVQRAAEQSALPAPIAALPEVGRLRRELARDRQAIDLDLPEQVVERAGTGWTLALRSPLAVERDNAEISLLVGTCAATLMLEARTGILRTVPAPDERTVAFLRRAAHALGIDWPEAAPAGDVLAGLDRTEPRQFAFVEHAAALLRGASYTPFHGELPEQTYHAGIGAPYAHVTAPLRRLVDRFGTEVCLAAHAGTPLPEWVAAALDTLPTEMRTADRLAHDVDRAVVDATEAWLLRDRVGQRFSAVVIDADDNAATVVLDDPAVRARCDGAGLPVGTRIGVRLTEADVRARRVRFRAEPIDAPRPASAP